EFNVQRRGCDPTHLQSVHSQVWPEERLLHQCVVDKVPIVLMLRVLVPDSGEKATALACKAVAERGGLKEGLLRVDVALVYRERRLAVKQVVHVRRQRDFSFTEVEA